ncbi:MAG: hypothetical protein ACT4OO_16385 [Nitrospiraceae bacterium]
MKLLNILVIVAMSSLGIVTLSRSADPMLTDSPKTTATPQQIVKGDLLMTEGEFYVLKDITGHEVRLHVNSETKMEGKVKTGDKIEAHVTPDGHATSITLPLAAPVLPGTEPASSPPSR